MLDNILLGNVYFMLYPMLNILLLTPRACYLNNFKIRTLLELLEHDVCHTKFAGLQLDPALERT